jgi:hypothetical protein
MADGKVAVMREGEAMARALSGARLRWEKNTKWT